MENKNFRIYNASSSLAFNSHNENFVLSNMYPCRLVYNDKVFQSAEQLFHWLLFTENKDIQNKILKCSGVCNAYKVKKLCEENKHLIDKDYKEKKYKCLLEALQVKYNQCKEFSTILKNNMDKELVEFAYWGDTEWGCTQDKVTHNYVGKNACGRLMMKVREMNRDKETC